MTQVTTEQLNALVNSDYFGPELKAAFGEEDGNKTAGKDLHDQAKAVYEAAIDGAEKEQLEKGIKTAQ